MASQYGELLIEVNPGLTLVTGIQSDPTSIPPLRSIAITERPAGIALSVTDTDLLPAFYKLASDLAERLDGAENPTQQLIEALDEWRALLQLFARPSLEKVVGIVGELWCLEQSIATLGASKAVAAWTGPDSADFDFRFPNVDVEVKTTAAKGRKHHIHGLRQLEPRDGRPLFMLSLRIESGGAGEKACSLKERLLRITDEIDKLTATAVSKKVNEVLGANWQTTEPAEQMWAMADSGQLIGIDDDLPRITPEMLRLSPESAKRIPENGVSYRLDVEGLGSPLPELEPLKGLLA